MANQRSRSRGWSFTANIPEGDYDILEAGFKADYLVWQYEMEGHLHIQGYVYFNDAKTMASVKKRIFKWCGVQAHLEKARGTPAENKTYCTKEETRVHGPWEQGMMFWLRAYPCQGGLRLQTIRLTCGAPQVSSSADRLLWKKNTSMLQFPLITGY